MTFVSVIDILLITQHHFTHFKIFFIWFSREKKQEGKPISILPTQTKTESTSTDISLSSQ